MSKNNFILYKDYKPHIDMLSDEQAGKLFKAIFEYVDGRTKITLDPITNMAFSFIKNNLERDLVKYKNIVERNRNNGLKGGRPKNPNNPVALLGNPKEPKEADIGTGTVIDTEIDSDIVKVKKTLYLEFVKLTTDEHDKLITKYGSDVTNTFIERLNDYVGSTGKKYKSHYHTILSWIRKDNVETVKEKEMPFDASIKYD